MGRRGRGRGSRGGPEGRGRVKDRMQARPGRGGRGRGPSFDAGDLEGVARRLAGQGEGTSALAGAASGLAGGGLAGRLLGNSAAGPDEDFRNEVLDQLALMDERLLRLEEQMSEVLGEGTSQESAAGGGHDEAADPGGNQ